WEDDDPILDDDHCNYAENIGDTTPIGHYSPIGDSPYGCTDMTGNISEWVADWYEKTYFQNSPSNNPIGPASGWFRVQRGGSWKFDMPWCMRVTFRVHENPNNKANDFGFRCAI
ncbi:MAG: SUMF1/EgtB/PvdO family nonheme iron enzyme, partial [Chloroflexi bacterium]|nr:SUMF1/EgtB/PvdO family nonheme iron enzyme [Chloroflexota bacterium]